MVKQNFSNFNLFWCILGHKENLSSVAINNQECHCFYIANESLNHQFTKDATFFPKKDATRGHKLPIPILENTYTLFADFGLCRFLSR